MGVLSVLWKYLSHGVLGFLVGGSCGYFGGEVGIRLREHYNRTHPKTPLRNYWGDTEGMYVVFHAFFVASALGLIYMAFLDQVSCFSVVNMWSVGLPLSGTAICAYLSFYT
jgi:hypothetical protein